MLYTLFNERVQYKTYKGISRRKLSTLVHFTRSILNRTVKRTNLVLLYRKKKGERNHKEREPGRELPLPNIQNRFCVLQRAKKLTLKHLSVISLVKCSVFVLIEPPRSLINNKMNILIARQTQAYGNRLLQYAQKSSKKQAHLLRNR